MKRILYDVPRWHVFLHRESRRLDSVDVSDRPVVRFQDELFDRLYSGEVEYLHEQDQDPSLREWAQQVHAACDQLPSFGRLVNEVRGDAFAAGLAVEALLEELRPDEPRQILQTSGEFAQSLRGQVNQGCEAASSRVELLREAMEGLEGAFTGAGSGTSRGNQLDTSGIRTLAHRLQDDERLKRIALLAGRFKRIAAQKQRSRVRYGVEELADIEQGSELSRLLPIELGRLLRPRQRLSLLRDLVEHRCLQYQLVGAEQLGKGPVVVCIDKSGSMSTSGGARDVWATAVALALLSIAQHQRRPYALLAFDDEVKFEAVVSPGEPLPEEALFTGCGGGTDIRKVLHHGLDIVSLHQGPLRKADLLLISDGQSDAAHAEELKRRAENLGATVLGFGIGIEKEVLAPWCDEVQVVTDLRTLSDTTAEKLFTI